MNPSRENGSPDPQTLVEGQIEARQLLYQMGFTAKEHIALAENLLVDPPKESFERIMVPVKHGAREQHLRKLRKLVAQLRGVDLQLDVFHALERSTAPSTVHSRAASHRRRRLSEYQGRLESLMEKFGFNWQVLMEMALLSQTISRKLRLSHEAMSHTKANGSSTGDSLEEIDWLESLVRMSTDDFLKLSDRLAATVERAREANNSSDRTEI